MTQYSHKMTQKYDACEDQLPLTPLSSLTLCVPTHDPSAVAVVLGLMQPTKIPAQNVNTKNYT